MSSERWWRERNELGVLMADHCQPVGFPAPLSKSVTRGLSHERDELIVLERLIEAGSNNQGNVGRYFKSNVWA